MIGVLAADWLKMKHTWIKALAVLAPAGVIALEAVNFHLREEWLLRPGVDPWLVLIQNVIGMMIPALLLGLTLLPALLVGMEHQAHAWKQLLALPIPRIRLYLGKFIWISVLLAVAALLTGLGTIALAFSLGFTDPIPWGLLFKSVFYPCLAALPLVALQLWLSTCVANQGVAITLGIVGLIIGFAAMIMPQWLPWSLPMHAVPLGKQAVDAVRYVQAGTGIGLVALLAGAVHFIRRDVN